MGLINVVKNIPMAVMNFTSSIFSSDLNSTLAATVLGNKGSFEAWFYDTFTPFFYFIAKWMLYIIDVLFAFVRQLCGLEMKFDSFEGMLSKESDFVFNLLLSGIDLVIPIVKNLIGLAIALIIFFAILAVIKTQFNSLKNKTPADIKGVFRDTLRAFVLLIITPMIAILGIIASNLLLRTLYDATNVTGASSISTQMFSVSTMSASTYRTYAQSGQRIPITFDFQEDKDIIEYYRDPNHEVTEELKEYLNSTNNLIYYMGYKMFNDGNFTNYDDINDAQYPNNAEVQQQVTNYYKVFDRTPEAYSALEGSPTINSYRKIESYEPEYYVMADVIDYGIASGSVTYFKTIEQVLESIAEVDDKDYTTTSDAALFNSMVNRFQIEFLNSELKKIVPSTRTSINESTEVKSEDCATYRDIFLKRSWSVIRYTSIYFESDDELQPIKKMSIQYNHIKGATDELQGAKFIMAFENEFKIGGVTYPYFYPLTVGQKVYGDYAFDSDFIQTGQIIAAKGIFHQELYAYPVPTAIRISQDGSEVQFYRHDLESVTLGETETGLNASMKKQEESSNFFTNLWKRIKAFFNPQVNVKVDDEALVEAYTYVEQKVNALPSGKLNISYMFEDSFSNGIGSIATGVAVKVKNTDGKEGVQQIGLFGLKLKNVFIPSEINWVILLLSCLVLVKIIFTAVFALINRSYELFLTIIIYPTACATIPIMDQDEGYKQWTTTYTQRLFATYGIILGLNFVVMLFPVIAQLQVFTPEDVASSEILLRFRNLFFGISVGKLTNFLNLVVVTLFQLVAFTLLETIPPMIQQMTGASDLKGGNPFTAFTKFLKVATTVMQFPITGIKAIINTFVTIFNSDKREQFIKNTLKKAKGFVPGSAVVDHAKDFTHLQKKKHEQKEAMKELKDAMNTGGVSGKKDEEKTEDEKKNDAAITKNVQEKFNNLLKAQSEYSNAVSDPRKSREAADDVRKKNRKLGLNEDGSVSSRNEDDAGDDVDLSHRTRRQLRREKRQANSIVKKLEKKQKKAEKGKGTKLTASEQDSLNKNKKIVENVQNAQNAKKSENSDYKKANKSLKELRKKRGTNTLNEEEKQQLKDAEQKVTEHKGLGKKNRAARKQEKSERQEELNNKKQKAKEEEKNKKTERAFKSMDFGSKRTQKKYMKKFGKDSKKLQKKLNESGYMGKKLEDMTQEELVEAQNSAVTEEQRNIIKQYADNSSNRDKMIGYTDEAMENKVTRDARILEHRNRFKAGTHGGNRMQKRMMKKEDKNAQRLSEIEQDLAKLDPHDAGSMKKYRKLKQEQQQLRTKQQFNEYWQQENTRDKKVLRAERKQRKRLERKQGAAYEARTAAGKSTDDATIRRVAQNSLIKKKDKKKGKKNK